MLRMLELVSDRSQLTPGGQLRFRYSIYVHKETSIYIYTTYKSQNKIEKGKQDA